MVPVRRFRSLGPIGGCSSTGPREQIAPGFMNPIRVHLGQMPRMLRTIINDVLTAERDIMVVGNSVNPEDSLQAASAESADMLITQEQASNNDSCIGAVLSGVPPAILAVAANGHHGTCISLVRRPISLDGDGSSLPDAVRELLSSSPSFGTSKS